MAKLRKETLIGLSMVTVGLLAVLIMSFPITSAEQTINVSFELNSGAEYGSPRPGTTYHTRILGWSLLKGEVMVEGGNLHLTVIGYNTENLSDVQIGQRCSFVIGRADDLYAFRFQNLGLGISSIHFTLQEIWTRPLAFASGPLFVTSLVSILLLTTGMVILIVTYLRHGWYSREDMPPRPVQPLHMNRICRKPLKDDSVHP